MITLSFEARLFNSRAELYRLTPQIIFEIDLKSNFSKNVTVLFITGEVALKKGDIFESW